MLVISKFLYQARIILAIFFALIIGALLILIASKNPFSAYYALFYGAFVDYYGLSDTLTKLTPIMLTGLAVVIPLRAGLFNIGAEGQLYIGALLSSAVAIYVPAMNPLVHIVLCIFAGALGGMLWALIPALLKAYRGINEVIVTILMNYIGINMVSMFVSGIMMQKDAPYPYSPEIHEYLKLPIIMSNTDVHLGLVIGFFLIFFVWIYLQFTTAGLKINMVGSNAKAAKYSGIHVKAQIIKCFCLSGSMAGLAGTFEVIGLKHRLYHLFSPGYGYDGIVVAFMSGINAIFVPISAFFLSGLKSGALYMQRSTGLDSTIVEAIQGILIVFVAASLVIKLKQIKSKH